MFHRLSKFGLVCALACTIGLHWAFWQAIAWTNMVAAYSREASFTEALAKTFDGKHPCALCKTIAEGKRTEKKSEKQFEVKKLEFPCPTEAASLRSTARYPAIAGESKVASVLNSAPPVPPPRLRG